MTSVVIAGALAGKPRKGGEAWVRLSYALGLRRLGCEVSLLEEAPGASSEALVYARGVAERFGLAYATADEFCDADLLVNVSGNLRSPDVLRRFRRRVFVDIDPGFTQLWHERGIERIPEHDEYFTIGENVGKDGCAIPSCGLDWHVTRPPVVLDEWPIADGGFDRFTTIASWRAAYGPIEPYGLKHHEWRQVVSLPARSGLEFEAALEIHPGDDADRQALEENGWRLVDPGVATEPEGFRDYVRGSGAEFSVSQGIYVDTRSGWFSDRSVRYLASGRPVLVQDTGSTLPRGEGLVFFTTLDEAVEGARRIADDYDAHRSAARAIAEDHFDSDRVLRKLLEDAL